MLHNLNNKLPASQLITPTATTRSTKWFSYDYLNADRNNFSPNYHHSRVANTANSIVYRLPSLFSQIEQTALATTSYISYNI